MSMSAEAVMRTWFDELWNQGQDATIDRFFAADAMAYGLPGGPLKGPAGFRPLYNAFRSAFPDIHIEVERTMSNGNSVAACCRVTGTHTGSMNGLPPTGHRIDFQGMVMATVVDEKVHECWNCFDFLTMYQQLGVVPPMPA